MSERMNSEQFKRAQAKEARERLENILADALTREGGICAMFSRNIKWHPHRKWSCDFYWNVEARFSISETRLRVKTCMLLVEVEGGTRKRGKDGQRGGGHNRPDGFQDDCEKYNAAAELGWIVLRYTSDDITKRLPEVVAQIRRVLER